MENGPGIQAIDVVAVLGINYLLNIFSLVLGGRELHFTVKKAVTGFFSISVVVLSGCVSTQMPAESQHYNPETSARIRLFGQNGLPSIMTVQTGEEASQTTEVNVGGGWGDAFSSFLLVIKNDSIGIPETENTQNLAAHNGILSKAFYREFVIPAGRPVKVRNAYIGLTNVAPMSAGGSVTYREGSCTSASVSFIPQAGKDYEVGSYKAGRNCAVMVFDIQTSEGKTTLVPTRLN